MSAYGLSPGSRLLSIAFAVGVHAAAAAAFVLTPANEPPPPPPGVEIEMLAEITSVVAEEVSPSVAAEAELIEQATEARAGENAADAEGEMAKEVAALDAYQPIVTKDEVDEIQKPSDQAETEKPVDVEAQREAKAVPEVEVPPEAETEHEAKATPEVETPPEAEAGAEEETPAEQAPVAVPVELEKPALEAPHAPALAEEPKPKAKATRTAKPKATVKTKSVAKALEKKSKTVNRQAMIAGSMLARNSKRKGESQAKISGGSQSSSEYRSIVQARLAARRGAIGASAGSGARGRVIIAFSIGASGRVTSASVSKSSGNSRLDAAARSVVAATSFPPPPGGSFRSGIPIAINGQ